jgi:ribonuclease HIII
VTTFVTKLARTEGERLYRTLGHEGFAFRPVDHAHWGARGPEVAVVWYRSGKIVVQGAGTEGFLARFLPEHAGAAAVPSPAAPAVGGPTVGSDESGKGDYFGALAVAAALVRPDDVPALAAWGVTDSKLASDGRVRRLEGVLVDRLPHAVRVLEPEAYNAAWAETGNLNRLLGRLHAEAIESVCEQAGDGDLRIVVDRFGDADHVRRHLGPRSVARPFEMRVRAEADPAVAAASFLARAAFLRSFDALRALAGDDLPLGASDPRIVKVARRLLREGGEPWLGKFAKLHFRVTEKARA